MSGLLHYAHVDLARLGGADAIANQGASDRAAYLARLSALIPGGIHVQAAGESQPHLQIPVAIYLAHLDDDDIAGLARFFSWFAPRLAKRAAALGGAEKVGRPVGELSVFLDELCRQMMEGRFVECAELREEHPVEVRERASSAAGIGLDDPRRQGERKLGQKADKQPAVIALRGSRSRLRHRKSSSKKRGPK